MLQRRVLIILRQPLDKELFPVHHPRGLKRADWIKNKLKKIFFFFLLFVPVYSSLKKIKLGKKIPKSRLAVFFADPTHRKQFFTSGWPHYTGFPPSSDRLRVSMRVWSQQALH